MTKCVVCHKESELTNGKCDICINEEIQQCIDLFEGTSKPRKKIIKKPIVKVKSVIKWNCPKCNIVNENKNCTKCNMLSPLFRSKTKKKKKKKK
mgnify:CR=1 FL=1|tara:strand:- start:1510 stop:1791 length:282 start_codon:yes stop_codon:yes gene_type:complete